MTPIQNTQNILTEFLEEIKKKNKIYFNIRKDNPDFEEVKRAGPAILRLLKKNSK